MTEGKKNWVKKDAPKRDLLKSKTDASVVSRESGAILSAATDGKKKSKMYRHASSSKMG